MKGGVAGDEPVAGDGAVVTGGVPLGVVRRELGGDEGLWEHPRTGEPMRVSLRGWSDADPDETPIRPTSTWTST